MRTMVGLKIAPDGNMITCTDQCVTDSFGNTYVRVSDDENESRWRAEHNGYVIEVKVRKKPDAFITVTTEQKH